MGAACTTVPNGDLEPVAATLAALARDAPTKTRVDLSCRGLGLRGAHEVAAALRTNTILRSLFLGWNDLEDAGVQVLCDSVTDSWGLATLILSGNRITDEGALHIGRMLKRNGSLTYLSLSANLIALPGAVLLLQALEDNLTLRTLSLGGNLISAPTIDFVTTTVQRNSSLQTLELGGNDLPPQCLEALQHWCRSRQKSAAGPQAGPQASFRALSQCTNPSSGPRDDDSGVSMQCEEKAVEPEFWRLEAASMMAQLCLSEKPVPSELLDEENEPPDLYPPDKSD